MDMNKKFDIIIVGAGISGSMAALAAAANGSRVILIEQHGFAGGMLTAAGVGPMMTFHAGQIQVVKGFTSKLVDRLVQRKKSLGHIFDTTGFTYTVTPFDAEAMKQQLDEMLTEAGVKILFHTQLAAVNASGGTINEISVCNKAGLSSLQAEIYIDATGDADLSAWANVPFIKGRPEDGKCQPQTMKFKMGKVEIRKVKEYIRSKPEDFPSIRGDVSLIDKSPRLSIGGFLSIVKKAKNNGDFNIPRDSVLMFGTNNPDEVIINTSRILNLDPTDPFSLTDAEIQGRKQVAQLEKFLIEYIPGFENACLISSGPNIGTRSSRSIKGIYTLTIDDILSFKKFDDAIAYSGYPVDVHPPDGGEVKTYQNLFKSGDFYSIPYRCLLNNSVHNLITVGRCVSATFEAQAAFRTTPTVGAIGHAGGLAASIASEQKTCPSKISPILLRKKLLEQDAFLM
jgi:hypothetical protein